MTGEHKPARIPAIIEPRSAGTVLLPERHGAAPIGRIRPLNLARPTETTVVVTLQTTDWRIARRVLG